MPPTPPDKVAGFLMLMGMEADGLKMKLEFSLDLNEQEVRIVRAFIERIRKDRAEGKTPSVG